MVRAGLGDYVGGGLSTVRRRRIERHLSGCRGCRGAAELEADLQAFKGAPRPAPPGFADGVLASRGRQGVVRRLKRTLAFSRGRSQNFVFCALVEPALSVGDHLQDAFGALAQGLARPLAEAPARVAAPVRMVCRRLASGLEPARRRLDPLFDDKGITFD